MQGRLRAVAQLAVAVLVAALTAIVVSHMPPLTGARLVVVAVASPIALLGGLWLEIFAATPDDPSPRPRRRGLRRRIRRFLRTWRGVLSSVAIVGVVVLVPLLFVHAA
ncbi:hypothetical protein AB0H83_28790 [Dactylosporangium sp. NPDC050688]|uniref:hypothetical protein n=1 Tax=Dactylosporangium sp. NPDC050688 TaxID=3157217 RepID=UPI0033CEE461